MVTSFTTEQQHAAFQPRNSRLRKKYSTPHENRSSAKTAELNPEAKTFKNQYSHVACYFFTWHTTECLNSLLSPLTTELFIPQILEILGWGYGH